MISLIHLILQRREQSNIKIAQSGEYYGGVQLPYVVNIDTFFRLIIYVFFKIVSKFIFVCSMVAMRLYLPHLI